MSYQKTTGPLMANSHPGSYCGQDAYNDMLVTENDVVHRKRSSRPNENERGRGCVELYARPTGNNYRGGETMDEPTCMSDKKGHNGITQDGTSTTLTAQEKERPAVATSIVRRLTPLECERLQGFPDGWTLIGEPEEVEVKDYSFEYDDEGNVVSKTQIGTHTEIEYFYIDENGKKKRCADSARYKALGNSIALPFWFWLLRRISAQYERPATLGSLFDGIGGFPLCWERCNGNGTALWASEIEEFPIAVTKHHFKEVEQ